MNLTVKTYAQEEVSFPADPKKKVREIFDKVCNLLSVRETWFFGLTFLDEGEKNWLRVDKEIRTELKKQINKNKPNESIVIFFCVKFYPEKVTEEIVLPHTQNLFYLQIKDDFLSGRLQVDPATALLLAAFIAQVEIGDLEEFDDCSTLMQAKFSLFLDQLQMRNIDKLLPDDIERELQSKNPAQLIFEAFLENRGMTPEESKLQFLKDASEQSGNFGVIYFDAQRDNMECDQVLGITPRGINVYNPKNLIQHVEQFEWTSISDLNFKETRFLIMSAKKKDEKRAEEVVFRTDSTHTNQVILDLCITNHDNFIQRLEAPSIELQQMKEAAKEENERRKDDRQQLLRERNLRRDMEGELHEASRDLHMMKAESDKLRADNEKLDILVKSLKEEIVLLHCSINEKDSKIKQLEKYSLQMHDDVLEKDHQLMVFKKALSNQQSYPPPAISQTTHHSHYNGERRARSPEFVFKQNPHHFNHKSDSSTGSEGLLRHSPTRIYGMISAECKSNTALQLTETLNFVNQMKGESDKLSAEINDMRLQSEKTFNVVRQGLDAHPAELTEY